MSTPALDVGTLLPASRASEGGTHWYRKDGSPCYEIIGANGQPRDVTLRDARKLDLVPSVSGILKLAAAPGLEAWKLDQSILAALTLPRRLEETEAAWLARVKDDSQAEAAAAADRGTEIHAHIERYYQGQESPLREVRELCAAVDFAIKFAVGIYHDTETELSFADPSGYGGKSDLLLFCDDGPVIVDFKTKDFGPEKSGKDLAYDEHCQQLAAYRVGLGYPTARCANVFIRREQPWLVRVHEWTSEQLGRGWSMFEHLLGYHVAKTGYSGAWQVTA